MKTGWLKRKAEQARRKLEKLLNRPPRHKKPVVVTPPTPPVVGGGGNLYRILHDFELPAKYGYGGKARTASPEWGGNPITPETCRIHSAKSSYTLSDFACAMVEHLNDPTGEYNYVTGHAVGWVNQGYWPKVECLTFAGNVVDVLRIEGNKAFIRTWHGEKDDPCTVHHWTNIKSDNTVFVGGWKGPAWIVLEYPGECWIELDKLVKV